MIKCELCGNIQKWNPLLGFQNYEASTIGAIRRVNPGWGNWRPHTLKPFMGVHGYLILTIQGHSFSVHRLIATTFLGPRPDGLGIDHKDGRKTHNCDTNLEYITIAENIQRADAAGKIRKYGEAKGRAKLSAELVEIIRTRRKDGETLTSLASEYGVHHSTIRDACTGVSWTKTN